MKLKCSNFKKNLAEITDTTNFVLKSVTPYYNYENGSRTEKVEGYRYNVADPATFENFDVKIASATPLLTQERLEASELIFVSFDNAFVKPYKIEYGTVLCSVTAENIHVSTK